MEEREYYTLKEASERLHVSIDQIRYLARCGLIPGVKRYGNRQNRALEDWQVDWAWTVINLKTAGFSTKEIRKYMHLCRGGKQTLAQRKAVLETQKRQLWQQLEELQKGIDFIERRQELYDKIIENQIPHSGDWI